MLILGKTMCTLLPCTDNNKSINMENNIFEIRLKQKKILFDKVIDYYSTYAA